MASSPFTVHAGVREPAEPGVVSDAPVPTSSPDEGPSLLRRGSGLLSCAALIGSLVLAVAWCSLISAPGGAHPLIGLPLLAGLVGVAALAVSGRRRGSGDLGRAGGRTGWMSLATLAVVGLVLVASLTGAPLQWRFDRHRAEFDRIVAQLESFSATDPARTSPGEGALSFSWRGSPYGDITVRDEAGGLFFLTQSAGDGPETGFVYLPTEDSLAAWQLTRTLQGLGGNWYQTP